MQRPNRLILTRQLSRQGVDFGLVFCRQSRKLRTIALEERARVGAWPRR